MDFPARLPALFLRPPTAAIYSDPRWKLVKGFRLHRYVAISFCIVAPVGQFPRSAFARKRPSGCGGRRVIGSGGEREREAISGETAADLDQLSPKTAPS